MHLLLSPAMRRALHSAAVLLGAPAAAFAGAMAITMQNGSQLGQAFSGGAAAEDASTIYFNPAGLTYLGRSESILSLNYVYQHGGFSNDGSTTAGVIPTSGDDGGTAGINTLVPTLYLAHPLSEDLVIGFGVSVPYGLGTNYDDGWVGRYHALKSELKTINLNPTIAWRPAPGISVGLGFDWQYVDAKLTNAVDFGLVGFANNVPGFAPGASDGFLRMTADDSSTGFNAGVLVDLSGSSRLGFHYRSKMDHDLRGRADFNDVPAAFAAMFPDQEVGTNLPLPEIVSLSFFSELRPGLAVMADWSWWNWSRLGSLAIDFADPLTPDSTVPLGFDDASIYSLGVRWQRSETVTWRAGVAYNESPVPSAALRTARIPDSDRIWIAAGASYRFADNLRGDFGLAHLFFDDVATTNDDGLGHVLVGSYSLGVTILSAQFNWTF